jgi:integrase
MAFVRKRPGRPKPYDATWRDPDTGKQRSEAFRTRRDAVAHGARMEAAKAEGRYVSPAGGKVTFRTYAESWRSSQVHRAGTANQIRMNFENHVYPRLGHRPLAAVRPSEVQALIKALTATLSPATVGVVHAWVSSVFKAALADRLIATSPCTGTKLPPIERAKVVPPDVATVAALAEAIDPRYRALIVLGAGTGVRIAEGLGLTVDRVDFLRRTVHIDRQLMRAPGPAPVFGPVKDRKNRPRTIPVGAVVIDALAAHMAEFGSGPSGLMFTNGLGGRVGHATWSETWRAAAGPLGVELGEGFHQLRHFYASTLIQGGESVKVVQERLGHADASMTLNVYAHLWPDDDDHTRAVTDRALAQLAPRPADQMLTKAPPGQQKGWSEG